MWGNYNTNIIRIITMAELCRLCLTSNCDSINIFSEKGISLNISAILTQFFFQIYENDNVSTILCDSCWSKLSSFSAFHSEITQAQLDYFKFYPFAAYKHEKVPALPAVPDPDAPIKIEPMSLEPYEAETLNINEVCVTEIKSNDVQCKDESDDEDQESTSDGEDHLDSDKDYSDHEEPTKPQRKIKAIKKKRNSIKDSENSDNDEEKPTRRRRNIIEEDARIREFCNMHCDLCPVKFSNFADASRHYMRKHKIRGYLICCDSKMTRRSRVLDHVQKHIDPNAYKCEICHNILSNRFSLKNHMDIHKSEDQKPFKCDLCPHKYTKATLLARHKLQSHCTEDDKQFFCEACNNKKFMTKSQLSAHMKRVHNPIPEICDFCGKEFKCKYSLNTHRTESHMGTEMRKLQCNICGTWLRENYLAKHIRRHNASTETCKICGKVLQNKNSLGNHMRNVHGDRIHMCAVCGKAFQKSISLREHMALHTGEDLYTCPYCPKTFKSGANMHSHRKKAHFEEWEKDRGKRLVFGKTS